MHIWQDFITEHDKQIIEAAGYSQRGAATFASRHAGQNPALLIIDMQRLFIGADTATLEAIKTAPTMIGAAGWRAIEAMQPLLATCRQQAIPLIYAVMQPYNHPADDPLLQIVAPLTPRPEDKIIHKNTPSVFFQTGLAQYLHEHDHDSVILVGTSTSGCIRAAAVDAGQHGFGVYVPYECVFDRLEASHKVSLLDMWMKYANVLPTDAMIAHLQTLPTPTQR